MPRAEVGMVLLDVTCSVGQFVGICALQCRRTMREDIAPVIPRMNCFVSESAKMIFRTRAHSFVRRAITSFQLPSSLETRLISSSRPFPPSPRRRSLVRLAYSPSTIDGGSISNTPLGASSVP